MDNPTKPETAEQNTGRADVSQGANSNLSTSDAGKNPAVKKVVEAHQHSGSEESDPAQQMDESGMLSPQGQDPSDQQPHETADSARMGQSGDDRNRER